MLSTRCYGRHVAGLAERTRLAVVNAALDHDVGARVAAFARSVLEAPGGRADAVIVRSSASCEDGAASSYAGLFASYGNLTSVDDVVLAVRLVWASMLVWEGRAEGTSVVGPAPSRNRYARGGGGMAVLIQRQVRAVVAGVAFSLDPQTGDENVCLVEAVRGLGEPLMSGLTNPALRARVDWTTETVVERQAMDQSEQAVAACPGNRSGHGGRQHRGRCSVGADDSDGFDGNVRETVSGPPIYTMASLDAALTRLEEATELISGGESSGESGGESTQGRRRRGKRGRARRRHRAAVVSDADLVQLMRVATHAAAVFHAPQDVEWCFGRLRHGSANGGTAV